MAKSKSKLKSLLQDQQSRLSQKQREKQKEKEKNAQAALKAKGKASGKSRSSQTGATSTSKRATIPFQATDTVLLVGEGNFSFARALVNIDLSQSPFSSQVAARIIPENITATSYDSEDECYAKYPDAKEIVSELRGKGVEVLFNVDATKISSKGLGKRKVYDRVVFNFPHAGKLISCKVLI
jgi:25S rRNA (uracil2634-N3)-methyltransferase